MKYNL